MPKKDDPHSGYGIGAVDEDEQEAVLGSVDEDEEEAVPVTIQIPVPDREFKSDQSTFKLTLLYADLPGGELQNDLNLIVVAGKLERHGNQGDHQFLVRSNQGFDRRNNVEQVVWKSLSADLVQVTIKPFRFMSRRVLFAYAWRFT